MGHLALATRARLVQDEGVSDRIPILRVEYPSLSALDADHAAYLVHGGLMVPVEVPALPTNVRVMLELSAPGGLRFSLPARSGRAVPGRGRLLSLEPGADDEKSRLDALIASPRFAAARSSEAQAHRPPAVELVAPPVSDDPEGEAAWETEPTDPDGEPPPLVDDAPTLAEPPAAPRPPERPPIRRAGPGERFQALLVKLEQVGSWYAHAGRFAREGVLEVPAPATEVVAEGPWLLRLVLPGHNVHEMWAGARVDEQRLRIWVLTSGDAFRRAAEYIDGAAARDRWEAERGRGEVPRPPQVLALEREAAPDEKKMPLRRRIQRMGVEDKINLALSGSREERMALAQDGNRSIHHYLLKNAKLTLDEIAFMARLPSLNPDVLDKIADNPAFTQNPAVTKALVFNPRTPVRTAIRLLDRLPRNDLNILSKRTGMNRRLVMAAKKKLEGKSW